MVCLMSCIASFELEGRYFELLLVLFAAEPKDEKAAETGLNTCLPVLGTAPAGYAVGL